MSFQVGVMVLWPGEARGPRPAPLPAVLKNLKPQPDRGLHDLFHFDFNVRVEAQGALIEQSDDEHGPGPGLVLYEASDGVGDVVRRPRQR